MRVVIIGGNAAGATAAAKLRRARSDIDILVLEKTEAVSFANCGLPYYIGNVIDDRSSLFEESASTLGLKYRLDIRTRHEAIVIDRAAKTVKVKNLNSGVVSVERYDTLILAQGAVPVRPPIEGIDLPGIGYLWTVADADRIVRRVVEKARSALVLGAGHVGCALAEALRRRGLSVALVEASASVMRPVDPEIAVYAQAELVSRGVDLRLERAVSRFSRTSAGGVRATLQDGATIDVDMAVICAGAKPDSALAKEAGLSTGKSGGLVVDDDMKTSDPCIYAAGDCVESVDAVTGRPGVFALAGPAHVQGRIAADNVAARESGWKSRYAGTQGSSIAQLWDLAIGMTGASTESLERAGIPYRSVLVKAPSRAAYYPDASELKLKLLYGTDGTVLGAHAAGYDGVDKRLDVIATAMRFSAKVGQLESLQLCYAPPFGTARDPVNIACSLAMAQLEKSRRQ